METIPSAERRQALIYKLTGGGGRREPGSAEPDAQGHHPAAGRGGATSGSRIAGGDTMKIKRMNLQIFTTEDYAAAFDEWARNQGLTRASALRKIIKDATGIQITVGYRSSPENTATTLLKKATPEVRAALLAALQNGHQP